MILKPVIGLEVHVELKTKSKMYCGCTTEFGGAANSHVCPVCMGLPGSLPRLNKEALKFAIKAGIALNCEINKDSRLDRKNYFYPDNPKNYQITQDEFPICHDGYIDIELEEGKFKRIRIERIHIEEDAGKLIHGEKSSFVDFNRAGVPLIEVVSAPDIASPEEATKYLQKLKSILESIGISDVKMEQGSLRCDGNISVKEESSDILGVRSEIKNVNSFKTLEKAIKYEISRQTEAINRGEKLFVETRRWDDENNKTVILRNKENANDYRYFPEGDSVRILVDDDFIEEIRKEIPELPFERIARFEEEYKLSKYDASVLNLSKGMADFFEKSVEVSKDSKAVANWLMGDISRLLNETYTDINDIKFTPKDLGELVKLINGKEISNAIGKIVIEDMFNTGKSPIDIIKEKGLIQNNNEDEILEVVNKILDNNESSIIDFKNGKDRVLGFIVGLVMKETKGKANPQMVNKIVKEEILKR